MVGWLGCVRRGWEKIMLCSSFVAGTTLNANHRTVSSFLHSQQSSEMAGDLLWIISLLDWTWKPDVLSRWGCTCCHIGKSSFTEILLRIVLMLKLSNERGNCAAKGIGMEATRRTNCVFGLIRRDELLGTSLGADTFTDEVVNLMGYHLRMNFVFQLDLCVHSELVRRENLSPGGQ